ncbi:MAG TPA: M6 family metalloprotease domain-containing protein [Allosphingosinicella sp.]|nr:M6 family metalloprotease domain-containing protein [Allosphingosinicella sp.]HYG31223.1 M6 family metalloprotease domain-containing protein [Allosphingosinicella sp.]
MSIPFRRKTFTLTQPDGSTLEAIGTGDQHEARFATLDGRPIVREDNGFYRAIEPTGSGAATIGRTIGTAGATGGGGLLSMAQAAMKGLPTEGPRWRERRAEFQGALRAAEEAAGALPAPPARQTVGTFVGLTLLIDFSDEPATISRDEIEAFCNRPGYSGFGNAGSVRDYFRDVSDGKLDYTNIVMPYYRAKHPRSHYTDETKRYPRRAAELIEEALQDLKAKGFNPAPLTADRKRFVYALNVLYAGVCENNWSQGLWPHAHTLPTAFSLSSSRKIRDYQITDIGDELSLGTFCHENGHMICDFPDLYDYGQDSYGAGKFCLMCFGGSDERSKNPAQVGAYLKHSAGWASSVTRLTNGTTVTLRAGRNEFALHRRNDREYYIIENRASAGRDALLGAAGLAVWHVDQRGSNSDQAGTARAHYECALVQADGLAELEGKADIGDAHDLFWAGHKDKVSDLTTPHVKWWDGTPSGLSLSAISAPGAAMTFRVG